MTTIKFQKERCLGCGTPGRPKDDLKPYCSAFDDYKYDIEPNGNITDTEYWYCSIKCFEKHALGPLIPERYALGKDVTDDPEYFALYVRLKEDYDLDQSADRALGGLSYLFSRPKSFDEVHKATLDEYMMEWFRIQLRAICDANQRVTQRIQEEWEHQWDIDINKYMDDMDKRAAQLQKEADEYSEQLAKERPEEVRPIPENLRVEHVHILGPSGSGKTTIIQNHILEDYWEHNPNKPSSPPAYIVIDPKGLMVERLAKLNLFADKTVIIDPFDAPALNLFKTLGRPAAQLISDFSYIFSTTNQKITGKQTTCFSFLARLLFTIPDAKLTTLLDLLDDNGKNPVFNEAISLLPEVPRRFFEKDYFGDNYKSTRQELKTRVYGIIQDDTLASMFNANTRTLDIAQCIRDRKMLLVNTRMTELAENHQMLGRYIITLVQDAIQSVRPTYPTYLVIDEFQEFADAEKTPRLLRFMREYGGGAVIAHQNMYCAELDESTRNAISTNTSIKYASSPEGQDLGYMARDLRCEPDWLKRVQKDNQNAHFACFVRGMSPPMHRPFITSSKLGWIDEWPKVSDAVYQASRIRNRAKLADTQKGPSVQAEPSVRGQQDTNVSVGVRQPAEADEPILPSRSSPAVHKPSVPQLDDDLAPAPWGRPKTS